MKLIPVAKLDVQFSERLQVAEKPGPLRSLAILISHSGDSWFWLAGLALLLWRGTAYWQEKAGILFGGIIATALVVMVLKFTIRRRRPTGEWGQIYRRTDPHSFPSGHAARALMLAVVSLGIGPSWLGFVLLVWAPLVGLARVAMGLHYLSDVLAGWLLGLATGLLTLTVIGAI